MVFRKTSFLNVYLFQRNFVTILENYLLNLILKSIISNIENYAFKVVLVFFKSRFFGVFGFIDFFCW